MSNEKKIPVIPPPFHNNNFISNLKEKSEVFIEHFPKQFFDTQQKSIDTKQEYFQFYTSAHKSLSLFQFSANEIKGIINKLAPKKARGHMITIRMIYLRLDSLYKPLDIIFYILFKLKIFPAEWKKANSVPVYKKRNQTGTPSSIVQQNI